MNCGHSNCTENHTFRKGATSVCPATRERANALCRKNRQKPEYKAWRRAYERKASDKRSVAKRDYQFRRRYGISTSDFNRLNATQNGMCGICHEKEPLVVDHCHKTDRVRGLLCHKCNTALGLFRDRTDLLARAAVYISALIKSAA